MPSSPRPLSEALAAGLAVLNSLRAKAAAKKPIWPEPYNVLTVDAGYRWLTECWWTLNEADGGIIELVPDQPFVRKFVEKWIKGFTEKKPTIFEKSRRMVVSWMARGLETWVMGLALGAWLIVDQTHENSAEHLWRCHFSLEQLYERRPELNLPGHDVRGAVAVRGVTHVKLANGSWLTQTHQEAKAAQGKGKTGITFEELSKYDYPAEFWGQGKMVTMGKASAAPTLPMPDDDVYIDGLGAPPVDYSGGWICAIANASTSPEWHSIKLDGKTVDGEKSHIKAVDLLANVASLDMEGFASTILPDGTQYVAIHYTADEGKRGDWAIRLVSGGGFPGGLAGRIWRREMELHEEGYEGLPVYETYDDDAHCPEKYRGAVRMPVVEGSTFIGCWDAGATLRPGFVLLQITPWPHQVQQLMEVTSEGNDPMSLYAPRVLQALKKRLPRHWGQVVHVGDATIKNRQGNVGKSAAQVAKEIIGVTIKAMSNNEQVRQSAVTDLLTKSVVGVDGSVPLFKLDGSCVLTRKGFLGGYHYKKMKLSGGGEQWKPHPEKNAESEPHDALQYGAQAAKAYLRNSYAARKV